MLKRITVLDQLDMLHDMLSPAGAWNQGPLAFDRNGDFVMEADLKKADIVSRCLFCAMMTITDTITGEETRETPLYKAIYDEIGVTPICFNEKMGRTQAQVLAMIDRARAKVYA